MSWTPDPLGRRYPPCRNRDHPPFPRGQALRADPGRIPVLDHRARRVQPPNPRFCGDGLGDGRAPAHRTRARCPAPWPCSNAARTPSSTTPTVERSDRHSRCAGTGTPPELATPDGRRRTHADTDVSRRWCGEEIRPGTGLAMDPDRGHPSSAIPSQGTSQPCPVRAPLLAVVEQHRVGGVEVDEDLAPHTERRERRHRAVFSRDAHMSHPAPRLHPGPGADHLVVGPQGAVEEHELGPREAGREGVGSLEKSRGDPT